MSNGYSVPVLLLVFNRIDTALKIVHALKSVKPEHVFIACDGPRETKPGETEVVETLRKKLIEAIDWKCEIKTLFRDKNLGCKMAVSSGITWFFSQVEEGIILEDDTLPSPDFFTFCETLLSKYRFDTNIMHISGDNFQFGRKTGNHSYYFSHYTHIWGWATWRRAWEKYDLAMKDFDQFLQDKKIESLFKTKREQKYWIRKFTAVKENKINTWDYQWTYSVLKNGGVAILPEVNLVTNIGFDGDGTHTNDPASKRLSIPTSPLGNLIHPKEILVNHKADERTLFFFYPILPVRFWFKLRSILNF